MCEVYYKTVERWQITLCNDARCASGVENDFDRFLTSVTSIGGAKAMVPRLTASVMIIVDRENQRRDVANKF